MFGRAFGHSHSALTSWQRLLNPAQNPNSTVIFISVVFLLSPSLMTAPVSSFCLQSNRAPERTRGVIDYWQLSYRILNYYSRVWWLAGLGSALLPSVLTESFFLLLCGYWNAVLFMASPRQTLGYLNLGDDCKWNASAVSSTLSIFYTLQGWRTAPATQDSKEKKTLHWEFLIRCCSFICECYFRPRLSSLQTSDFCFSFVCSLLHVNTSGISHDTEAFATTTASQGHKSSVPCLSVPALGLLSVIGRSKEGEHGFVLQSVSFVRVDMEEGMKQLDKMALMCLKNLLSLIKARTHAAQKQTEKTQFSTFFCWVTVLLSGFRA